MRACAAGDAGAAGGGREAEGAARPYTRAYAYTHIRAYTQVQQEVVEKRKELRTLEKLMVKLLDVSMRAVL